MGLFPVMTTESGQCAAFPDVCKTPTPGGPVPIPYPNIAMASDGKGSKKVKVRKKEVLRKGDTMRMSSGDEAGSAMGVKSNKIKGKATVKTGSAKVKAEKKQVAYHTVMIAHNGSSANMPAGCHVAPSQMKVKVFGVPPSPDGDPLDDGLTESQRLDRAIAHYQRLGWSDDRILNHLEGVDFSKPVQNVTILPGNQMGQWQPPGGPQGNYYAHQGTSPGQLGLNPNGGTATSPIPKINTNYTVTQPTPALQSTAGNITDTWSQTGVNYNATGGGTQYMVGNGHFGGIVP